MFNPDAKILYYPHESLTTKTELVKDFNEDLFNILDQMRIIMLEANGIGLSANQLGYNLRMFIVRDNKKNIIEFINPEIVESSGVANIYEGCLSSPKTYEKVMSRANEVTVVAKDRNGNEFTILAEGLEAVATQHEYDHILGIFWFDKLPNRHVKRKVMKTWEKNRKKLDI